MLSAEEAADLIEAIAARQERAAFAALFRHFAPRVKAFVRRGGADSEAAQEVVQEAMVLVWRKARSFDRARASAATWIFTIARNKRIDALRRERRPELDPADPALQPAQIPDGDALARAGEREEKVRRALKHLPDDQVELLRLSFFAGKTHRDIADQLRLPIGTVKSRMSRAFEKLRSILQDEV